MTIDDKGLDAPPHPSPQEVKVSRLTEAAMPKLTPDDRQLLDRAFGILNEMAIERIGWRRVIFGRWYYPAEPLRNDAANLLRVAGFSGMIPTQTRRVGDG